MESGAFGKEAAALRITVIAGVSCSFLLDVVAELEGQCSVNIDLRQGWFGDDARGCFGPRRQKKHENVVDLSARWEMKETRYKTGNATSDKNLLKFAGLISRPSHGRSEAGLVSNVG